MEKGQSKMRSLLEANMNTLIGFCITLLVSPIAYRLVGMKYTFNQLWQITAIFTVVSVIRGYVIRRFFNLKEKKKDNHLINQITKLQIDLDYAAMISHKWRNLYESTRARLSKQMDRYSELVDKYANLEDEYELAKHYYRAHISDQVEQANYNHGEESSKSTGN